MDHIITCFPAVFPRLLVQSPRIDLGSKIAFKRFLWRLPNAKRVEFLQIRVTLQKNDPGDQLIRMVHLLDAFLAAFLGHMAEAPVLLQPVVQPILADCRQFMAQGLVEVLDDLCRCLSW